MKRSSTTKKALFISTCALLFSLLMMAGSTFAWFTDSVSTGSNKITTGSLDVQLLHQNQHVENSEKVTQSTLLFTDKAGKAINWEPGAVAYENFTVKNNGNLALNYRLALDLNNANTIAGTDKSLKDVLKVKIVKGGVSASDVKEDALKKATNFAAVTDGQINIPAAAGDAREQKLAKDAKSATYGVILYWQPDPERDYEYNLTNYPNKDSNNKEKDLTSDGNDHLSIDLGISLAATQAMEEADSAGNTYDQGAIYPASSAAELKDALSKAGKGDVVELTGNIALDSDLSISRDVTIRSTGGAVISGESVVIGSTADVTLQGITFKSPRSSGNKGISLKTSDYAGKLVLDKCTFEEPQWSSLKIDAKASASVTIKNCTFDASGTAAGHKCDKESDSSALADGAHRILSISGASGTELTMTDNTFKGLDKCDASSAVLISGITGSGLSVKGNTADTLSKVSIGANGSTSGFTKK